MTKDYSFIVWQSVFYFVYQPRTVLLIQYFLNITKIIPVSVVFIFEWVQVFQVIIPKLIKLPNYKLCEQLLYSIFFLLLSVGRVKIQAGRALQ